jgi:phage virion morphogenesis protein
MTKVEFDDTKVLDALKRLNKATDDLRPALKQIGEYLQETTKQRFTSTTAPDGSKWLLNTLATLDYKQGDRPLTGETGVLGDTIVSQIVDKNTLEVGSFLEYAAMQQFGGTKSEFPHLWGDIPARPFLGLSEDDEKEVLEIVNDHLLAALK